MLSKKARRRRRELARMIEANRQRQPDYVEAWLNDPRPTCPCCGQPDESVRLRSDPYLNCLYGDGTDAYDRYGYTMQSCEACWWARYTET